MEESSALERDCRAIRQTRPLVHNITNYVAMNIAANALLAIGASPLMSWCEEEMEEIVTEASGLVINTGCLDKVLVAGSRIAAATASRLGKPWVLDPVGAGASRFRAESTLALIRDFHPDIIRGNASEISFLAGKTGVAGVNEVAGCSGKGADSTISSDSAVRMAMKLATDAGCVVSMSGATDYVTDGARLIEIRGGSQMMTSVTAMGCTASALTGAFASVNPDLLEAAAETMQLMAICGEKAAGRSSGTGSFAVNFLDELSNYSNYSV